MDKEKEYFQLNKKLWNARTEVHVQSDFYKIDDFKSGSNSLNKIELDLLGEVKNTEILHLQCHFGQDTLSLARMGASVTGIDLSDKAVEHARKLASELNLPASFVCCNLYDTLNHVDKQFETVFTSYGTIGWLPELARWAKVVSGALKKGGQFIMADFHPVVWMFDNEFTRVEYSYFNRQTIIEESEGTYTDRTSAIKNTSVSWNHDIAEILTALINEGLTIKVFQEYDYSPYNCFSNTVQTPEGFFQIKGLEGKIPMVYAIKACKE